MTETESYLVLDQRIVRETDGLKLTPGPVEKSPANPLFSEDYFSEPPRRWEARYDNFYPNVVYDLRGGDSAPRFRLWYNVFIRDKQSEITSLEARRTTEYRGDAGRKDGLLYGESADGTAWAKSPLGIVEFDGSRDNNIVMDTASNGFHGAGVLFDPEDPDAGKRFKAFFRNSGDRRMAVAFSPDGLHWSASENWPEHDAVGDTHNSAIRMPDGTFVGITRGWVGPKDQRVRAVLRTTSSDFVNWSNPVEVLRGNGAHDQIYSIPIFRVGSTYLGLPAVFHKGEKTAPDWDTVDTELAWSPDTITWNRVCPGQPLIPRGPGSYPDGAYDCGCIYAAAPVLVGDKHHIYYGGSNGLHNGFREGSFCLATLPRDRFAGYSATAGGSAAGETGRLVTTPFVSGAGGISVNVDIQSGGRMRAALVDSNGEPIDGFDQARGPVLQEGGLNVPIEWGRPVAQLAGREIRLELTFSNATVFALSGDLQFTDETISH